MDQDAAVGFNTSNRTRLEWLTEQSKRASELNAWLDEQSAEIAAVQSQLAAVQRRAALQRMRDRPLMLSSMSDLLTGGAQMLQPVGSEQRMMDADMKVEQLQKQLQKLLDETKPWFYESGNLVGDLNGDGRIAGQDEISRPFQVRVVPVGMHDETFDILNDIGFVQMTLVVPKALKMLSGVAVSRIAPRLVAVEGGEYSAIGSTGQVGEQWLAQNLGGERNAFFRTNQGARFVDNFADGIANESKVGYTSLTPRVQLQISKDVELMQTEQIQGSTWHFFQSPVSGLGGPSQPLLNMLQQSGINVIIH